MLVFNFLLLICQVYFIGHITFVHAPFEKFKKNTNTILFPYQPVILKLVVLCHIPHMILNKFINLFAQKIHTVLG